ncbi:putative C2H2-type domain-containing protein [Seiridium cardinale]|uniref:C2H2-type domain-containing protein n=1 Tax=Seiridium cardinale TaxID=138064 RepID=A0ABR2XCF3_9PEZI
MGENSVATIGFTAFDTPSKFKLSPKRRKIGQICTSPTGSDEKTNESLDKSMPRAIALAPEVASSRAVSTLLHPVDSVSCRGNDELFHLPEEMLPHESRVHEVLEDTGHDFWDDVHWKSWNFDHTIEQDPSIPLQFDLDSVNSTGYLPIMGYSLDDKPFASMCHNDLETSTAGQQLEGVEVVLPVGDELGVDSSAFQNSVPLVVPVDSGINETSMSSSAQTGRDILCIPEVIFESERLKSTIKKRSWEGCDFFHQGKVDDSKLLGNQEPCTDIKNGEERILACPFYKKDSSKYQECHKFGLKRIKDVKQHIYRKHKRPDYYCPKCFNEFNDPRGRDDHVRGNSCAKCESPHSDMISEDKKKKLAQCFGRSKPIDEQWYAVWDLLFPGRRKPQSPYMEDGGQEVVHRVRCTWNEQRSEIIRSVIKEFPESAVTSDTISRVVDCVFERLEQQLFLQSL